MAVIKIVPMPGAVGDKGDEGAPGPQGPQGPAGQNGLPGTPALWSYQGAWQSNAAYATGDIVTYQGQLYYTKSVTTAGTLPTDTSKFDLIAAKGADGEPGLNGLEGETGPQGPAGEDGATPFTLIGPYDNGASYNLGIAVYYNGGTYVRTGNPLNPGYPPEVGAINASWTPIAEKGEPGTPGSLLNYWDGTGAPQDPAEDGFLIIDGIVATNGSNILVSADDRVFIGGNNGEFLNGLSTPENQIATIGDIAENVSSEKVRYSPLFQAVGLEFTGQGINNPLYPTYNSYYVKSGKMVSFVIEVDLSTVTNFGTGQYYLQLPFVPAFGFNHFTGWVQVDTSANPDVPNGHVLLNVDHAGITNILDLHYLKQAGGAHTPIIEGLFSQGTPVTLTTSSKIYVNGTYISA